MQNRTRKIQYQISAFVYSIILSILLLSISSQAYVSMVFSSTTIPSNVEPGNKANLLLTITNAGNEIANNVKLVVKPTYSISPDQASFDLGILNPGGSSQIVVPLTVSSNAAEGTAAVPFTVSYTSLSSVGTTSSDNSASITITKRKLIQITDVVYDKSVIQRGDIVKMTLTLQNLGTGKIKDLTVSIRNFTLPIAPASTDTEKYVGTVNSGDKVSVAFDLAINNNADTITYSVPVSLVYFDDQGLQHSDMKFAGLKITGIPNFVVAVAKEENIFVGSKGKLSISIANTGTGSAKFLTAYLSSNDSDVSPKIVYIGNLDPDDTNTLTLDANSISLGRHQLALHLSYKDSYNQDFSKDYSVGFDVEQRPINIPFSLQIIILVAILVVAYWKRSSLFRRLRRK